MQPGSLLMLISVALSAGFVRTNDAGRRLADFSERKQVTKKSVIFGGILIFRLLMILQFTFYTGEDLPTMAVPCQQSPMSVS